MKTRKYIPMLVAIGMASGAGFTAHAVIDVVLSPQTVYINGREADLEAYNIDGSNYFKLRDLGDNLGFSVDYDEGKNSIMINSDETKTNNDVENERYFTAPDGTRYYPGETYIDDHNFIYEVDEYGDLVTKGAIPVPKP